MLPVYQAISFQRILEKGGRTKPWVVLVSTPNGIKPYVVKLFETSLIDVKDSVTNEVLGNVLASEFDLKSPPAAYIDFSKDFLNTIRDEALFEILFTKDKRLKFGTELIEPNVPFDNSVFNGAEARRIIDIDTVFAFDYLIRNRDRTRKPPNILINNDTGFLIDHELGFEITKNTSVEIFQQIIPSYQYHVFYRYLKLSKSITKIDYFNEFEEYLRTLNVNVLNSYFKQLVDIGFSDKKRLIIENYLLEMKLNLSNFVKLMRAVIA